MTAGISPSANRNPSLAPLPPVPRKALVAVVSVPSFRLA